MDGNSFVMSFISSPLEIPYNYCNLILILSLNKNNKKISSITLNVKKFAKKFLTVQLITMILFRTIQIE